MAKNPYEIPGIAKNAEETARPTLADCAHADKALHEDMSEQQVDEMIEESFPASDPPSTY